MPTVLRDSHQTLVSIWRLLQLVVVVSALYFLEDIVALLALAALITFLLTPMANRLERAMGNLVACLVVFLMVLGAGLGFVWLVGTQLLDLATDLPDYKGNLLEKVQTLSESGEGPLARVAEMFEELEAEVEAKGRKGRPAPAGAAGAEAPPVEVAIVEERPASTLDVTQNWLERAMGPAGSAGIVLVLFAFMLLKRDDLRDRIVRLSGKGHISETTKVMVEAAQRVRRFLLMQLVVNVTYGLPVAIGLYFIGVPNAALWGLLATVLRFIPYVGPLIAMLFPIVLSLAVFDGWREPLLTIGLFFVLEQVSNNVVEPWLYGSSTGISSFALIVAALFWTWLWGPLGLLLSTPLTVCLLVMGRHLPQLETLVVLLGEERALTTAEAAYQRFLVGDVHAVLRMLREGRGGRPGAGAEVLMPALVMLEEDRRKGVLPPDTERLALDSVEDVLEELELTEEKNGEEAEEGEGGEPAPEGEAPGMATRVCCVPVDSRSDELSALVLRRTLSGLGFEAAAVPAKLTTGELVAAVEREQADFVWLCAVSPRTLARTRHLCGELSRQMTAARIGVALWDVKEELRAAFDKLRSAGAGVIATRLEDVIVRSEALRVAAADSFTPAPTAADEEARLREIERLKGALEVRREMLERTTAELTKVFEVPIALATLVTDDQQLFSAQCGLPESLAAAGGSSRDTSVCGHVVVSERPLVVKDLARDRRFAGNPFLREHKLRFYAGVPLRTSNGVAIGALCLLDNRPRTISRREVGMMEMIAESVMADLEMAAEEMAAAG